MERSFLALLSVGFSLFFNTTISISIKMAKCGGASEIKEPSDDTRQIVEKVRIDVSFLLTKFVEAQPVFLGSPTRRRIYQQKVRRFRTGQYSNSSCRRC